MSSLPRSITNNALIARNFPLKETQMIDPVNNSSPSSPPPEAGRGVKDDFSDIKNSITRKLRGVAAFLAPPPQTNSKPDGETDEAIRRKMEGIRNDFAEIGGKVKAGFSKILEKIPPGHEDYHAKPPVGVTEELLAFVKDLVTHPRTWVRFPLPEDCNADDFAMNDPQQLHVGAVERHVPELGVLRLELCPEYLTEGRFWMIYFVLVYPKLDKYDALTLSSPRIVEARASMTQESKHRRKVEQTLLSSDGHSGLLQSMEPSSNMNSHHDILAPNEAFASGAANDPKHLKATSDASSNVIGQTEENESDEWLNEETPDVNGNSIVRDIPISYDENVSFSDLEGDIPKQLKATNNI